MLEHLRSIADDLGLPFGDREHTYNSRLAQELGLWAETMGRGDDFHMAAFHAYFARGENLALPHVLLAIIDGLGLSRDQAEEILAKRSFAAQVDADWDLSRKMGVTAVPTCLLNGNKLVGAQSYGDLQRFAVSAGVQPRR
jgi:predicted DsbA family dithiol-disulfide isomerase